MAGLVVSALRSLALGPIDLTIEPYECVSLRGASGAGKTLLLRAIADLDRHEGKVLLEGVDARDMSGPEWRSKLGMLPTESAWWAELVRDHFSLDYDGELEALGLPAAIMGLPVEKLSTGERQRLALLRLLAGRPRALLLDEPTASLDEVNVERVESLVGRYRESSGAPVLWVTHDRSQAQRVATRHFALAGGLLQEAIA